MTASLPSASLTRRLAALGYDALLLGAMIFVTTGIVVPLYIHSGLPVADFNGVVKAPAWFSQGVLLPLLLLEIWAFYAWFWLHGGQTLGMKTWRIHVRRADGGAMTLLDTFKRFAAGLLTWVLLGAGYLLALLPGRQTLHDRLSGTMTVTLPKPAKKASKA